MKVNKIILETYMWWFGKSKMYTLFNANRWAITDLCCQHYSRRQKPARWTEINTHKQISFSVTLKMFFEYLSKNVQFLFLRYSNCITKHFLMAACQQSRYKNHKIVMILLTRQSLLNRFQLNLWFFFENFSWIR